ncbi:MAG: transcriptional repressor, partial [Thermanaeromonas sp.]|uniref:Fur family transcriptional regulator n=1 Tax=Thermanaeromonas sp. TaxID=2003697 RepID=UPI00243BCCE8
PEHPTVEKIYQVAKNYCSTLGLATVYRTLDLFAQLGIAQKIPSIEGITRYDIDKDSHVHFICLECGETKELEIGIDILVDKCKDKGFEIAKSSLIFFGYCPSCRTGVNRKA